MKNYVLMTAAHNEEQFIGEVLRSVVAQTLPPRRWVIVSDNSSDRTDEIVEGYARRHDFIRLLHVNRAPGRSFGAKVLALRHAEKLLADVDYEFIGNIDADVSLKPTYFEEIVRRFEQDRALAFCAGFLYENSGGEYRSVRNNSTRDVFHAAQLARRECYEEIGGYAVLKYGGEDWYAQTMARMKGWHVEAIPELKIYHHRHTTGGSRPLQNAFRQGKQDYSFGSAPLFEMMKCLRRIPEKPYLAHAFARFAGFLWPCITQEQRAVPEEVASFLRREQNQRISQLWHRPWKAMAAAFPRMNREKAA